MPLHRLRNHVLPALLLLLLFGRLLFGSLHNAMTADEPSHLASGYAALARGVDGLWTMPSRGHPPLVDAWLALPLYCTEPGIPLEELDGWQSSYAAFFRSFRSFLTPVERVLLMSRVQGMMLALLLAAVVCRWARDLWGPRAGLLALGALVLDPTLVAHGRLATNDVGLVALGTCALYVGWRWWADPTWRRTLVLAVLLAATMLAKQSGVVWVAAFAVGTLFMGAAGRRRRSFWLRAAVAGIASLLLLWAVYGFTVGPVPALSASLPAPLHWQGIFRHRAATSQRLVYALGLRKAGDWWWYLPLAFLIKNPLPFLLLAGAGLVVVARRPFARDLVCALGILPLLYAGVAIAVGMNIGYRHMLPLHPTLYLVLAGGMDRWVWSGRGAWRKALLAALGLWYFAGAAAVYPYEISYFSELVGGPSKGYLYLADSNLDWGQLAHVRQDYLEASLHVSGDPPVTGMRPAAGQYLVGASYLQGLGIADTTAYEWFRHRDPALVLNYGLLVYEVPPVELEWVAQCTAPRTPLSQEDIARGTGYDDLRLVPFDCREAWVYPGGGRSAGIYALHLDHMEEKRACIPALGACAWAPSDPLLAAHVSAAHLSYEQPRTEDKPPSVLYEWTASGVQAPPEVPVYAPRPGTAPSEWSAGDRVEGAPSLGGRLALLSVKAHQQGDGLVVETWWRADDGPIPRPFSIMGQLLSASGDVAGMYDSLGVSPLALLPGDVLVQRHWFDLPADGGGLWLRTGAYWLDSMERWALAGSPDVDALVVPIEVRD